MVGEGEVAVDKSEASDGADDVDDDGADDIKDDGTEELVKRDALIVDLVLAWADPRIV